MLKKIRNWISNKISDPFGKQRIRRIHEPILQEIVTETHRIRYVRRFPMAYTAGHPRLRTSVRQKE